MEERTIAAISTPLGDAGIGVIRISGSRAFEIADSVFRPVSGAPLSSLKGYTAAFGSVFDGETRLDDCVALVFRAPKSYTGEDVAELSLHGGRLILKQTLRLLLKNGACHAQPGEFTKRAFLNGKTDLTRAESIMGLISAQSMSQLRLSRAAYYGENGRRLEVIEEKLLSAAASIAAFSDFPDEEIDGLDPEGFAEMLSDCRKKLEKLLAEYDAGRVLREGIDTVIVGKPNVGKSTLMNLLSGAERSIVTEIAGTTRDVIEDTVIVGDLTLRLADTAGIHYTDDPVETAGVERARARLNGAQLVLAVFDGSDNLTNEDMQLLDSVRQKNTIVVINKSDLGRHSDSKTFVGLPAVEISAKTGSGIQALADDISRVTGIADLSPDSAVLGSERQRDCAQRAATEIAAAEKALSDGCTLDAVGVCVDGAIGAMYELTGKRVTNEVTDEIFRKFCVGK